MSGNGPQPELLEIEVEPTWTKLIRWCQGPMRFSQVCVHIKDGAPDRLIDKYTHRPGLRFDKDPVPIDESDIAEFDRELQEQSVGRGKARRKIAVTKVSTAWVNVVYFCHTSITNGQVCFEVANGNPQAFVPELSDLVLDFHHGELLPTHYQFFKDLAKGLDKPEKLVLTS